MSDIRNRKVAPNNVNHDLFNDKIPFKEVRVIGADGEQLGVMSKRKAQSIATSQNLDLLCVAPKAKPPVCKILDYGRYHFEQQKKEKEAKRKARMEALKNRPAEQRPNSKQIDVIKINDKSEVQNYGYAVKNKEGYQGVVVTSVLVIDGKPTSTSVTFVPGNLTVKSKKGHGIICNPKAKKAKGEEEEAGDED